MTDKVNNDDHDEYIQTCSNCKNRFESWYFCTSCNDYRLCLRCKEKINHPHPMRYTWPIIHLDSESPIIMKFPDDIRALLFKRCLLILIHAFYCQDYDDCVIINQCHNMKRLWKHTVYCQLPGKRCSIRQHVKSILYCHIRLCKQMIGKCVVPFCTTIKQKHKMIHGL
ncbi:histone acetyltransferase p300-like [Chelonus insularis]|uniref:histone acetyltransferase p300-like n=1 Tax=Chelonus insularis TaxID=460826 RepID=UPI00158A618C|nr:histone acetyltransferase p300-like [Chelonus insularis]